MSVQQASPVSPSEKLGEQYCIANVFFCLSNSCSKILQTLKSYQLKNLWAGYAYALFL